MLDREKIRNMRRLINVKEVEEMSKKQLIDLLETITDGFIEVYNDNVTLSQMLSDIRHSLDDIDYSISQIINDIDGL